MSEVLKYDNLLAGNVDIVTQPITIDVSQTIQRGDILKKVSGKFQRPTAVIASTDVVVVASEDITTDASTTVASIGYKTGQFDSAAMRFGGSSTADDNVDVLADKSIYLTKAQKN
ncbi:hypothetical protein D2A34_21860 [Clostridium chromiireducens]|uniref:Head decoration protein n=1 Tax=Clostridium chromiireducens TaxID=225345 RepID=A0A399IIK3_9CLOT|nr:hypothetical protein [Clostridium chromiireducens]RII32844.1 hypothetical protein D2A34_21860 [Clostridium chromiireducens]